MSKGWILLHRQIQDNWIWQSKRFDNAHAFIDLLILANGTDKKTSKNNRPVLCKRGTVNLSILELSKRWGWHWRTVNSFLQALEQDGMVIVKKCQGKGTTITLVNYDKYQILEKQSAKQSAKHNAKSNAKQSANNETNNKQVINESNKTSDLPPSDEGAVAEEEIDWESLPDV
jgi:DNA-binding transcriptional regulator YhcF (GntR family)